MAQLYLFTGENTYALREERARWVRQFSQKYGEENLMRLEGAKLPFRELLDEVSVAPFIAPKRLVIVDGVLKASKEEIRMLPGAIHPETLVVFVDAKPDKRLASTKELMAVAETKEFKPLTGIPLQRWVHERCAAEGAAIEQGAILSLLDLVGEAQDMLDQELQKLALHAGGRPITVRDVEEMVSPSDEGIVWKLTDILASGRKREALAYAKRLLDRGGDAYGLWAILLNLLKNTVAIHAESLSGTTDSKAISEATGVHFMAVRSILPLARSMKTSDVRRMNEWAVEADKGLKTGLYRSTDEAPEELHALIDRFLLSFPS